MNFEFPTEDNNESMDERWYDRFAEAGSFQAYEYLDGDKEFRDLQKEKFLNGEMENPELDYPKIDPDKLLRDEENLLELKSDILNEEENETLQQAYRWKINEKVAEVRMLRAVHDGDMRRFKKYSEFVYGKPSPEIFSYTVSRLNDNINEFSNSETHLV